MARKKTRDEREAASPPKEPRRGPTRTAFVLLAALALGGLALYRAQSRAVKRDPKLSVLLITIDTLRADALGVYGGPAETPWIDRLAREGVRFETAHAHNVVTFPSHANILSGQLPLIHGVHDNTGFRFPAEMPTLATRLKALGFNTAAFVSAFVLDSRFGLDRGFDLYDDRTTGIESQSPVRLPDRLGPEPFPAQVRKQRGRPFTQGEVEAVVWSAWQTAAAFKATDYLAAVNTFHRLGRRLAQFHERFELLLTPTLAEPPAVLGRFTMDKPDFIDYRLGP